MAFVCLLELQLHFPDNGDLKGKRKELQSLKANLRRRFGATVAETDHHDLWQRSTLVVALVSSDHAPLAAAADGLQRFVDARFGDLTRWERTMLTTADIWDE